MRHIIKRRQALVTIALSLGWAVVVSGPAWGQNYGVVTQGSEAQGIQPSAQEAERLADKDNLSQEDIQKILAATGVTTDTDVPTIESSRYTLGPMDVISISVMRHPEVSGEFAINKEGKIQYEFVGDVKIAGLTKDQAKEVLAQQLSEYIISPEVNVKITGYNSKVIYVVGEVYNPGKIYMRGDTITVREALMQAGLPMLSGITKKSKLITPSDDGNAVKKDINVYALLYEGDLRENDTMRPGDVLYIPPTFLTKAARALSPITTPVGQAAGLGRTATGAGF